MKRIGIVLLIMLMVSSFVTGCGKSKTEVLKVVRVACFPNLTHAQGLIDISEKVFQNSLTEGINVEWKSFNSGTAEIEAFFAGELDLGLIGPIPATNGFVKSGGEIRIVSGVMNGGAVLIASAETDIKELKDLEGKKIAVPSFGNTQDFMLRKMLEEAGLSEKAKGGSVEIIPVKNQDLKSFFSQGNIDAAFVPEPWGSQLISEVGATLVLDTKDTWRDGDYPTTVVVVRKTFMDEHPEIVKEFLKANIEITKEYRENQEVAVDIVGKEILNITGSEISEIILKQAFSRMTMSWDPKKNAIADLAIAMEDQGFIDENVNVEELCDFKMLNELLIEIGEEPIQ